MRGTATTQQQLTNATDEASLVLGLEIRDVARILIPLGRGRDRDARRGHGGPRRGVGQGDVHEHLI